MAYAISIECTETINADDIAEAYEKLSGDVLSVTGHDSYILEHASDDDEYSVLMNVQEVIIDKFLSNYDDLDHLLENIEINVHEI